MITIDNLAENEPVDAKGCAQLGAQYYAQKNYAEAKKWLSRAIKMDANIANAWLNLGALSFETNDLKTACEALARAVSLDPQNETAIHYFLHVFPLVQFQVFSDWVKNVLIFCLKSERASHQSISRAWANYLAIDPAFAKLRAYNGEGQLPDALDDAYLLYGLQRMYICSPGFERWMTQLRKALMLDEEKIKGREDFLMSLATQCWMNEYIYVRTEEEIKKLAALKTSIEKKAEDTSEYIKKLCLYACYEPLHTLKNAQKILETVKGGPQIFKTLLRLQIEEPLQELEIRKEISNAGAIDNGVSKKVQAQYEENPYPRWKYAHTNQRMDARGMDILIAGCGTGQQAAMSGSYYYNARIHNIDLSLASLGYAVRQTRELGLKNLTFEQADILSFDSKGQKYDMVECIGVLHHMENPEDGLKALIKLLKPGGKLVLGLYAALPREDITQIRAWIAKEGYGVTPDEIRRARQDIAKHPDQVIALCAYKSEFFSMSNCRDMIMHAQEHVFTIPELEAMLKRNKLAFKGFMFNRQGVVDKFKQKFPETDAPVNLKNWDVFEKENPALFAGMYVFTAQPEA